MMYLTLLIAATVAFAAAVQGSSTGTLNVTLQLTTTDFLSVSTLMHAAAEVWGVKEANIHVISATARYAAKETPQQTGARHLLEVVDTAGNIQIDFAAMQRDDPKLLTLKDFVMSSNQAPQSPTDVLSLLQAFEHFKQGSVSDDYMDSPSARYALTSMRPGYKPESPQTTTQSEASANQAHTDSLQASDTHPHLLFLKTGGGATVSQPKHHLTPQQLQMLADGTGTLEGFTTVTSPEPLASHSKAATVQQHGPLGIATVVLDANKESTQQLASLFTPRNDHAVTKAVHSFTQAQVQPAAQGLFSSASDQQLIPVLKATEQANSEQHLSAAVKSSVKASSDQQVIPNVRFPVRPSAKSLQGVYMDQSHTDQAGFPSLRQGSGDALSDSRLSLSRLDKSIAAEVAQSGVATGADSVARQKGGSNDEQRRVLRRAVLLTMLLSIATNDSEALKQVVGDSILSTQLQQEIGKGGFTINQLDASFDKQGIFSSHTGAFSVEISESTQGGSSDHVKLSVRTVVKRNSDSAANADNQSNTSMVTQAHEGQATGTDDNVQSSWTVILLIYITGFLVAFSALVLGIYKFGTSRTGQQASEHLASGSNPGFWICGQNPLRQPLIPKHAAAADEIC